MNGWTTAIVGVFLVAGLAMPAMAFQGGPDGCKGSHSERHMQRFSQQLNLSDEQQQKIRAIHDKDRESFQKIGQQMRDNRKTLFQLDTTAKDYDAKVKKLARQQGELVERMIVLHSHERADVNAVLTAEQREQAKKLMQQRRDRMKDRMRDGKGGNRGWSDRPGPGGMRQM